MYITVIFRRNVVHWEGAKALDSATLHTATLIHIVSSYIRPKPFPTAWHHTAHIHPFSLQDLYIGPQPLSIGQHHTPHWYFHWNLYNRMCPSPLLSSKHGTYNVCFNTLCTWASGLTTDFHGYCFTFQACGWPETSNWPRPLPHLLLLLILRLFFQFCAISLVSLVLEHSRETLEYQINSIQTSNGQLLFHQVEVPVLFLQQILDFQVSICCSQHGHVGKKDNSTIKRMISLICTNIFQH
jgi:hypothetical protein